MTRKLGLLLKSIAFVAVVLSGCSYLESKEELAAWVKQSMQEEVKKDDAYQGLAIGEVVLVRESFNKFSGYIEFKNGADVEKATLVVTVDGDKKMYQCEPPRALMMKRAVASATAAAEALAKTSAREECVEREMAAWEEQRDEEISAWCAELAKKGEECRTSAGQDEIARQEALEKMTEKCQQDGHREKEKGAV